jgi:hypothetical protein
VSAAAPDLWTGALCEGQSDLFLSADPDDWAVARSICAGCPLERSCREYAVTKPEFTGVWGGTDETDRRRIRNGRRLAAVKISRGGHRYGSC